LRARSLAIDDRELTDAIELLRAEMSVSRKVEVRESVDLVTPATIGWRRPLVLLPHDWRDWNQSERVAVLAHEVAHVHRGDFVVGVAAHFSVALHFYHPLAHWLAARLRLEQEMAADAWAARLLGGRQPYLETLAHMALRRADRSLTWPARAFLPSRGSFVRRIDMLRNSSSLGHASLSTSSRVLTVGTLAAIGLLVAGLRGPAVADSAVVEAPAPTQEADATAVPANELYNLAFVPADAKMVLAIRPQTLLRRREFGALADQIKQLPALRAMRAVNFDDIEQVLAFWEGVAERPDQPGRVPMVTPPAGIVVRLTKPTEWKSTLNQMLNSPREVRHAGHVYLSASGPGAGAWSAFPSDDRTLVIAREDLLRELIEDRSAPGPRRAWDEAWQKVAKGQMMLALETRWLRRRLAQGLAGGPPAPGQSPAGDLKLEAIAPLLEETRSYALGIDASDGVAVDLVVAVSSDADAKPVAETLHALMTLAKNSVQGMRQDTGKEAAESGANREWALVAANSLLEKARIDTSGRFVRAQSKSAVDLSGGIKLAEQFLATADNASRREASFRNLRQIALAIHNYASANRHLPTPALLKKGSKIGFLYSWRVAILPFLDANDLYQQYNFDEPWDGPNNRKLLDKMPAVYGFPGVGGQPSSKTNASYFVFASDVAAFGAKGDAAPTFADFRDGTSNTIWLVEAKRDIPWTKPEDIPFDPNGPLPQLGGFSPNSFSVAFADGSVRSIKNTINPDVFKALITRAGGETVNFGALDAEPTTPMKR
jgi:hypothetical protein